MAKNKSQPIINYARQGEKQMEKYQLSMDELENVAGGKFDDFMEKHPKLRKALEILGIFYVTVVIPFGLLFNKILGPKISRWRDAKIIGALPEEKQKEFHEAAKLLNDLYDEGSNGLIQNTFSS